MAHVEAALLGGVEEGAALLGGALEQLVERPALQVEPEERAVREHEEPLDPVGAHRRRELAAPLVQRGGGAEVLSRVDARDRPGVDAGGAECQRHREDRDQWRLSPRDPHLDLQQAALHMK